MLVSNVFLRLLARGHPRVHSSALAIAVSHCKGMECRTHACLKRFQSAVALAARIPGLLCRNTCSLNQKNIFLPNRECVGRNFVSNLTFCASGATTRPFRVRFSGTFGISEKDRHCRSFLVPGTVSVDSSKRYIHSLLGRIGHLQAGHACVGCVRWKSRKGRDRDSEEESDEEDLDDDDYDAPINYKRMKIFVKSLRADSVVSSALDISRNRVDEIFYGSRLHVNGEKLLKKSKQLDEGDYIDLVVDRSADVENQLMVKRVKIINVSSERTNKDKLGVTVKVWKSPFAVQDATKS